MSIWRGWRTVLAACALLGTGAAQAEGFVWRVADGDNSVYLAGSVHLLPPEAYPLPDAFQEAYEAAEIVAFETEIGKLQGSEAQTVLFRAARYDDGSALESHLDDELYGQVNEVLGDMGVSISAVRGFRPWFVAGMIEVRSFMAAGYRQDLGVDTHFYDKAEQDDKAILPLETLDRHLAVLTEMPPEMARAYLAATVENVDELEDAPTVVYDFWRAGDADGLADYVAEQMAADPALYERLLFARNRQWMDKLENLLAGDADAMVVVGALHLVGERGLLEKLEARGYEVVRQ